MQTERNKASFGTLFGRGWKLFGRTAAAGLGGLLLCQGLPGVIVAAVSYYVLLAVFQPVIGLLRTVLQTILEYGLDEWAIGQAVNGAMGQLTGMNVESMLFGAMGGLLVMLGLLPLLLGAQIFLAPWAMGAAAQAQSRAWHGVKLSFRQAFDSVKSRYGKLVVLGLVTILLVLASSTVMTVLTAIPFLSALSLPLSWVVGVAVSGVAYLMFLIALNEDVWGFSALGEAFRRFFTDGMYAAVLAVTGLICGGCQVLFVLADAALAVYAMFPPVLNVLLNACAAALYLAMVTSVYYDQRKHGGYAPECRVEGQTHE